MAVQVLTCILIILPFCGFALLALAGSRIPRWAVSWIGTGSVGISAAASAAMTALILMAEHDGDVIQAVGWTYAHIGQTDLAMTLCVDHLSIIFVNIITIVAFLIHLYSVEFMGQEEGYSRFFAYMNLFVASMVLLVLAGDLILLYIGWEGVGLCSYLLIGFWYEDPKNGMAARKAFIVTRIGDTAMAIGLFILLREFNTLNLARITEAAAAAWEPGSAAAVAVAMLLLGGALGKSAQLPLQTWLPDAMAGPSPVSALIHAATMVTAGVYLVARTHGIFELAPDVMRITALIGAATLLMAGLSAMTQTNIKRILAYSTISQVGYMFMALGAGAWSAAVFHFAVHAFFKALLFLGAGAVIFALHDEHDIRNMGGLWKKLPLVFWTFLAGGASLSSLPLVTAGFFSKEEILWYSFAGAMGNQWLWTAGVAGSVITAAYTFRMIYLAFFGEEKTPPGLMPGWRMGVPLAVLAVLSIAAGFIELPDVMGDLKLFTGFIGKIMPQPTVSRAVREYETALLAVGSAAPFVGLCIAWLFYRITPGLINKNAGSSRWSLPLRFLRSGWGFDWLYDVLIVKPLMYLARINKDDCFDSINHGIAAVHFAAWRALSMTQTGRLRWYLMGITIGAIIFLALAVLL